MSRAIPLPTWLDGYLIVPLAPRQSVPQGNIQACFFVHGLTSSAETFSKPLMVDCCLRQQTATAGAVSLPFDASFSLDQRGHGSSADDEHTPLPPLLPTAQPLVQESTCSMAAMTADIQVVLGSLTRVLPQWMETLPNDDQMDVVGLKIGLRFVTASETWSVRYVKNITGESTDDTGEAVPQLNDVVSNNHQQRIKAAIESCDANKNGNGNVDWTLVGHSFGCRSLMSFMQSKSINTESIKGLALIDMHHYPYNSRSNDTAAAVSRASAIAAECAKVGLLAHGVGESSGGFKGEKSALVAFAQSVGACGTSEASITRFMVTKTTPIQNGDDATKTITARKMLFQPHIKAMYEFHCRNADFTSLFESKRRGGEEGHSSEAMSIPTLFIKAGDPTSTSIPDSLWQQMQQDLQNNMEPRQSKALLGPCSFATVDLGNHSLHKSHPMEFIATMAAWCSDSQGR